VEIKKLKETGTQEEQNKKIKEIENTLLQKMNISREMESFYVQIEAIHKDFNLRLAELYPNLTEQEKKLITFLRLGFSSKHIASLVNISPKSVEISRYRLRNKLGLTRKQKLISFIKSI
jgi:DNA-binding NarL/FixJ family response regulator